MTPRTVRARLTTTPGSKSGIEPLALTRSYSYSSNSLYWFCACPRAPSGLHVKSFASSFEASLFLAALSRLRRLSAAPTNGTPQPARLGRPAAQGRPHCSCPKRLPHAWYSRRHQTQPAAPTPCQSHPLQYQKLTQLSDRCSLRPSGLLQMLLACQLHQAASLCKTPLSPMKQLLAQTQTTPCLTQPLMGLGRYCLRPRWIFISLFPSTTG